MSPNGRTFDVKAVVEVEKLIPAALHFVLGSPGHANDVADFGTSRLSV